MRALRVALGVALLGSVLLGGAVAWDSPPLGLPERPAPALTLREQDRLRAAFDDAAHPGHAAVLSAVRRGERRLEEDLTFPPEGGHHNQWYQCVACQLALETVDAHHHGCGKCGTVYEGYPFDNVVYARTHRHNGALAADCAWAFAITARPEFAARAAQILLGYAERYRTYEPIAASVGTRGWLKIRLHPWAGRTYGRVLCQTLSEAAWVLPLVEAFDLIRSQLTPEQCKAIRTGLFRPIADRLLETRLGRSNWQTWHNAALLWLGAALEDDSLVRRALVDPRNGFAFQMQASVTGDGLWHEGSWGYHYYTLQALTWLAEGARRLGMDVYGHPVLESMYLLGLRYRMPDGSLPRFGDDVQSRPERAFENEAAYAAYGNERLLSVLSRRPTLRSVLLGRTQFDPAKTPSPSSELFPAAGHAILRAPGPGAPVVAVTFGPYGGFHGHLDKLSFVLFAHGEELGVDPGRARSQAYRLPIHRRWYKATLSHNALLVDGKGQRAAQGALLAHDVGGEAPWVWLDAGPALPGVRHQRLLLASPRYVLVVDDVTAQDDEEHTYHWLWHGRGVFRTDAPESDVAFPTVPGAEFLQDARAYAPAGDVHAVFATHTTELHIRIVGAPQDVLHAASVPFRSVEDRNPWIALQRRGRHARFVSVLEPVSVGATPTVEAATVRRVEDELVVEVRGRSTDTWRIPLPTSAGKRRGG